MVTQTTINGVFSSVAPRYDLMNDIMSFGLHRLWKRELCSRITRSSGALLDVAGGTGDIALQALTKHRNLDVTVCDINPHMLGIGRKRAVDCNQIFVKWVCASGERLPFANHTFDYYTIAFGIRNIPNRAAALREAYRVLKPCGQFLCLEFSPILEEGVFKTVYDFYSFSVIPKVGQLVAKDAAAYSYLVNSIRNFPSQECFAGEIRDARFSMVTHRDLCCGVATLYSAFKA